MLLKQWKKDMTAQEYKAITDQLKNEELISED